jgi:hypothetical protein
MFGETMPFCEMGAQAANDRPDQTAKHQKMREHHARSVKVVNWTT